MKKQESRPIVYSRFAKQVWKLCFALGLILMVAIAANAQGSVEEDPDTPVPVDGGISLLVAAGIGYGAKKIYDKRKANKAEEAQ